MSDHTHDRETCRGLAERLSEYLDDELPDDLRQEVVRHFEGCSTCEQFLDSLRRAKDLGSFLPEIRLTPETLDRLARDARRQLGL